MSQPPERTDGTFTQPLAVCWILCAVPPNLPLLTPPEHIVHFLRPLPRLLPPVGILKAAANCCSFARLSAGGQMLRARTPVSVVVALTLVLQSAAEQAPIRWRALRGNLAPGDRLEVHALAGRKTTGRLERLYVRRAGPLRRRHDSERVDPGPTSWCPRGEPSRSRDWRGRRRRGDRGRGVGPGLGLERRDRRAGRAVRCGRRPARGMADRAHRMLVYDTGPAAHR